MSVPVLDTKNILINAEFYTPTFPTVPTELYPSTEQVVLNWPDSVVGSSYCDIQNQNIAPDHC